MGFVWAVRRSLRLLTLLTLMASALCSGQSLAAQEIAAPRATFADSVAHQGSLGGDLVVAAEIFADESAVTITSAISPAGISSGPAFAPTATLPVAPAAPAPPVDHFSPLAERAPPAA